MCSFLHSGKNKERKKKKKTIVWSIQVYYSSWGVHMIFYFLFFCSYLKLGLGWHLPKVVGFELFTSLVMAFISWQLFAACQRPSNWGISISTWKIDEPDHFQEPLSLKEANFTSLILGCCCRASHRTRLLELLWDVLPLGFLDTVVLWNMNGV